MASLMGLIAVVFVRGPDRSWPPERNHLRKTRLSGDY